LLVDPKLSGLGVEPDNHGPFYVGSEHHHRPDDDFDDYGFNHYAVNHHASDHHNGNASGLHLGQASLAKRCHGRLG
jgi:hypothetical protein